MGIDGLGGTELVTVFVEELAHIFADVGCGEVIGQDVGLPINVGVVHVFGRNEGEGAVGEHCGGQVGVEDGRLFA